MKLKATILALILIMAFFSAPIIIAAEQSPLLTAMKTELDRSMATMKNADQVPLYYLSYHVTDTDSRNISSSYGAIISESNNHDRILDIDCRVGSSNLDNSHEIRGENDYDFSYEPPAQLPLENDPLSIRTIIWKKTDDAYRNALERYTKVMTNEKVLAGREDTSADFSVEKPNKYIGATVAAGMDAEIWKGRLKKWSAIFKEYPFVKTSGVSLSLANDNRYFVNSDGALIQTGQSYARLILSCAGAADDGMEVSRYYTFDSDMPDKLPTGDEVDKNIYRIIAELDTLMHAPMAEPYTGPAILVNRASGVFFHEIFGHRIEGHRQKSEVEGQTFARKVGQQILPDFISIYDDPTLYQFNSDFLRGHYLYDDEGVKSQRVPVVEKGVLENFLMSRSPIRNFPVSNGHGRMQAGAEPCSRQGNLIVQSTREYPYETLVNMMLDECRKQGKPYGLVFVDISGGFTQTGRYGPQSFKVLPLLVYRYYADGRPPEAIRGVDIVGTPLSSFEKIMATGNDYDVFDGTCGAESGWVPVSAVSPSILVSQLEVEKKMKEQEKPPILKPPYEPKTPQGMDQ